MKSYVSSLLALSIVGLGVVAGCAEGTTDEEVTEAFLSTPAPDAGTEKDEHSSIPAPSNPAPKGDSDAGTSNADAGADSGVPNNGGGGGNGVACTSPNACSGSVNLGEVKGDNGADVKTAQGYTSQWFQIRVTEDDDGFNATELALTATLTSPPGANFDLFLYIPSGDSLECTAVSQQSTSLSTTDSASVTFGESGFFSNGSDDDRTVTVEVRHVSGTCDSSKKWTLTLSGNQ